MNGAETNSPEGAGAAPEENNSQTPQNPNEWKMPTPVFQQSSGYLPQGYIEQFGAAVPKREVEPQAPSPEAAAPPTPPSAIAPEIVPQPDLNEQLEDPVAPPAPAPPVKKKSGVGRVLLILLGIGLMILFLAGFLAIIYFLFIAPEGTGGVF